MRSRQAILDHIRLGIGAVGFGCGLVLLLVTLAADRPAANTPLHGPPVFGAEGTTHAAANAAVRQKGGGGLVVFRKQGRGAVQLRSGAVVRRGDLIQIGYAAPEATHGVIFSVDGRGQVTLHYPARVGASTALEPFGRQLLPYAFELDGAPAYERILFVTAGRPIDVRAVLTAGADLMVRSKRDGMAAHGLRVADELLLKKRTPR